MIEFNTPKEMLNVRTKETIRKKYVIISTKTEAHQIHIVQYIEQSNAQKCIRMNIIQIKCTSTLHV